MLGLAVPAITFLIAGPANAQDSQQAWSPGSSSVLEPELFPSAFRGRWAPDQAGCQDIDGVNVVQVYPTGVDSYESGGRLVRVTQSGQRTSVKVRLSYEGEGRFWDRDEVWTLSARGDGLDILVDGETPRRLVRCG
jgi:hypothetical protein